MKQYKIIYISASSIFAGIALIFSILCFHFNLLFEAIAITGLCLVMVLEIIGVAIIRYEGENDKLERALGDAGEIIIQMPCLCRDTKGHSGDGTLYFCEQGLVMDNACRDLKVIAYHKFDNLQIDKVFRFHIDNIMYECSRCDMVKARAAAKYIKIKSDCIVE